MPVLYLDASALAKLLLTERESPALERRVAGQRLVTSALSRVEVSRAVRRGLADPEPALALFEEILGRCVVLPVDAGMLGAAAGVEPPTLRTLDAIHLASALLLADELDAFVTYDRQLGTAAAKAGLLVEAPR